MIAYSLAIAALSAPLGHWLARTLPGMIFEPLGYPSVTDASTAGMMAVACGLMFVLAVFLAPREGIVSQIAGRIRLRMRIAQEDLLATLYRADEKSLTLPAAELGSSGAVSAWSLPWLLRKLRRRGELEQTPQGWRLTIRGRDTAARLIRSHRLWESYVAQHFELPLPHLHASAEQAEHYLDPELSEKIAEELQSPAIDPQGKQIPPGA